MSTTTEHTVTGMTCEHCVAAVKDEVGSLPGVSDVTVDLVAGGASTVAVTADTEVPRGAVEAAVAEAGYTLT